MILDYLSNEAEQDQLVLDLDSSSRLALGSRGNLVLRATSSRGGRPVAGAEVTVRMISTVAEPRSLARGRTDGEGRLRLAFDIPPVGRGTAALIIGAASDIGSAELKQLL